MWFDGGFLFHGDARSLHAANRLHHVEIQLLGYMAKCLISPMPSAATLTGSYEAVLHADLPSLWSLVAGFLFLRLAYLENRTAGLQSLSYAWASDSACPPD